MATAKNLRASRLAACALAGVVGLAASARADDAQAKMRRGDELHRLPLELLRANMVLQSEQGDQRSLSFEIIRVRDPADGDKMRLRFLSPADIKGMSLLTLTPPKGEGEQWLYLPSFRKTRRVGGAELGDRFAGSDFFYEDLKQRPVDDFRYKLLKTERFRDADCLVLEGVPATPEVAKDSPYGKKQVWLRASDLVTLRVRVFDRQLKPVKEFQYDQFKKVGPKAYQPDLVTVVDVQRKHRTVVTVEERQTQLRLPPETFSQHALGAQ